jgi:hypothetical protein
MPKTDFDEFVKRQQAEKVAAEAVDWSRQRDEWLSYLNALYEQIESFLKDYPAANEAQCDYRDIQLNEENIGSYSVRQMILRIGRQEITFTPIGTLLIAIKGRVDVLGPSGRATLFLVNKKATGARSLVQVKVSVVGKDKIPPSPPPVSQPPEPIEWAFAAYFPPRFSRD